MCTREGQIRGKRERKCRYGRKKQSESGCGNMCLKKIVWGRVGGAGAKANVYVCECACVLCVGATLVCV